ncbi:hypothetical protein [Aestuariivirga sp.]|uniref:hypothetical protein n=1 Tax=Aestuariivirga sp. TaxID=2650926 RepID=UPI0039E559A5
MTAYLPFNLSLLHEGEERTRQDALDLVAPNLRLQLHLKAVEAAMLLADTLRQLPNEDEDFKVFQLLGLRLFNAFGSSVKLLMAGYFQNGALILRDVLETLFLLDLLSHDRALVSQWRIADRKVRKQLFSPAAVRKTLDDRDGLKTRKREKQYVMFSELAGHPSMQSAHMLRPQKDADAVIGPFMVARTLEATLTEAGRLAVQIGELLDALFPKTWEHGFEAQRTFAIAKREWFKEFYPHLLNRGKAGPGAGSG